MSTFNLDNEPKIKSGFTTPEGYFENFSAQLLQQLPAEEPKVIPLYRKKTAWISATAAVLALALLLPVYNRLSADSVNPDADTIENYIAYQSGVTQYDLINSLEPEDISAMHVDLGLEDQAIEDVLSANGNLDHMITE